MSVIYDQLKKVEATQAETSPPMQEEKDLPLEEELECQRQEVLAKLKEQLVKNGSIALIFLFVLGLGVFIYEKKFQQPQISNPLPEAEVGAKAPRVALAPVAEEEPAVVQEEPVVVAPAEDTAVSIQPQKEQESKIVENQKSEPVAPITEVESETESPEPEDVFTQKVSPEMLAKTQKSLSPIQVAQQFYQAGALDKAIESYNEAIKEDSKQLEAYNNLGVIYTRKGWVKAANQSFKDALRANPYYAEAHYNFAVLLEKEGKNKQALGHYLKFVEYARPKQQELVKKVKEHINLD